MLDENPLEGANDHVVEGLERRRRILVYLVSDAAGAGLNRIARTAAILSGYRRKLGPTIITFALLGGSVEEFVVP